MNSLSIGLVTSSNDESKRFAELLQRSGIHIRYQLSPDSIQSTHIEDQSLKVWLLNIDEEGWHDNVDLLLDGTDATIYFNEQNKIEHQSDLEQWCQNLAKKLYQLVDLPFSQAPVQPNLAEENIEPQADIDDGLTLALDELESSSLDIPADIAEDLVSELESISPELESNLDDEFLLDSETDEFDQLLDSELESEESPSLVIEQPEMSDETVSSETEEISSEILELASSESDSAALSTESTTSLDTIDFSESSISMLLESIEESDDVIENQEATAMEFGEALDIDQAINSTSNDNKTSLSEYDQSLELTDELELVDPLEVIEQLEVVEESESSVSLDLALVDDELSLELEGESQNPEDLDNSLVVENDVSLETGLSLEEVDEEVVTGKAIFIDEQREPEITASESDVVDIETSGLSLESIDQEAQGKANFLVDDDSAKQEDDIPRVAIEDSLPETDLSLELTDTDQVEGKVEFKIDDPNEDIPTADNVVEELSSIESKDEFEHLDTGGLSLQSLEDETDELDEIDIPKLEQTIDDHVIEELKLEDDIPELGLDDQIPSLEDVVSLESEEDVPTLDLLEGISPDPDLNLPDEPRALTPDSQSDSMLGFDESNLLDDFTADDINLELAEQQLAGLAPDTDELATATSIPQVEDIAKSGDEKVEVGEQQQFEIPMLEEAAPDVDFESVTEAQSTHLTACWVVGASLGGPAAVKRFLQSIPKDIQASFIIVQHIDEKFLPVLAEILTNNSHFEVKVANGSNQLAPGDVYLAPLKGKLIFLQDGSMLVDHSQKWTEPYAPCIDDVISSLARVYKNQSGAIIFSGMGDDGLRGSKEMLALGGKIWAQSVDTCANSSMPEAIIEQQLASVIAAPEVLASRFANLFSLTSISPTSV